MSSTAKTNHEHSRLEGLQRVVHGLRAPFACGGTLVPEQPVTLAFPDQTQIPIRRANNTSEQEQLLQPLVDRCAAASFGVGRKTRYDRTVRDALQIKAEGGAFSVLHFDPAAAGILEQVRRELAPHLSEPLTAELYNLNIYQRGGHFAPHKDTPRGIDMLGTLVVCLPSQFSNGAFVVKHHGVFQTYEWDDAIRKQAQPSRIHWAAFFGDVDHQIEQVWSGLRVTLTYLIRRGNNIAEDASLPGRVALNTLVREELHACLADRRFLAGGGTLAFPCSHLYHQDARFQRKQRPLSRLTVSSLKGRDHAVAVAAMEAGLEVTLCPYMIENCCDETWQLDHFPTARERTALGDRMDPTDLAEALPLLASSEEGRGFDVIWVDPPPNFNAAFTMYPGIHEGKPPVVDPELPALKHLHACEYSATGYFGNEGGDIDLYVYGALHVAIPPFGEGVRVVTKKPYLVPSSTPRGARKRS